MDEFAKRLKQAMFLKGMKQTDIANKANISKSRVSRWVKGENIPSGDNLRKIAKALGVSVDYLLGKEEFKYSDLLPAPVMVRESYLTDEEHDLLEAWKKADEKQKQIVRLALNMPEKASNRPVERF